MDAVETHFQVDPPFSNPEVTRVDLRSERRKVVITVGVLSAWIIFVIYVVKRCIKETFTAEGQTLESVSPLLFVILVSVVFLILFCMPENLGSNEDVPDDDGHKDNIDICNTLKSEESQSLL